MKKLPRCYFYNTLADLSPLIRKRLVTPATISHEPLTIKNAPRLAEAIAIFVDSKINKQLLATMPRLKLITTMSTGFDHIDLAETKKRSITVCNVPTYGENTVAEHTMALILAISRKLFLSVKRVKEGVFDYHDMRGFDLAGKTVGVIGTGHIGKNVIQMLGGFNMRIIAYDPFPDRAFAKKTGVSYMPLSKLLSQSDIITLHTPLLPSTYHLINKKTIKKIKRGAHIVNTARGGLIDPEALLLGLETGHIAGAGLDVLEKEEFIKHPEELLLADGKKTTGRDAMENTKVSLFNNILIDHPKVIVTPHNAFNSVEAVERIFAVTIDNINAFMNGRTQNVLINK